MLRTLSRARARAHTLYAPCRVPRMERYMERSDKAYMEAILALNLLPACATRDGRRLYGAPGTVVPVTF